MQCIKYLLFLTFVCISSLVSANIVDDFNTIKSDPNALYAFFKDMPKGGELHYHLAGGGSPETMLGLAAHGNYCIDQNTLSINKTTTPCNGSSAAKLDTNPEFYNKTVRAWSMKDFIPGSESGHDHFFAAFGKFHPVAIDYQAQLLADTMQRAANQHELYMEIMVSLDSKANTFGNLVTNTTRLADKQKILLSNKDFQNNLKDTISESSRLLKAARRELGCDKSPQQPVCGLIVKFQYFVLREQPLDNVFARALNGFAAAAQSENIVGVNLVQPEDGIISTRDYHKQMEIFKFLHAAYPNVHIALHAGELTQQTSPTEDLRFHIHDAILTGKAERIGHGVDIAYENDAKQLLQRMAKTPVAVEINLISNREILGVTGKNHPLQYYLAHHVPVVLSTDDEGILRTDLTQQYVEAVINHGLDYPTIKHINRNALTYSFLPGKSIWSDANKQTRVSECQNLSSDACEKYTQGNIKAKLQWELEKKLAQFESESQQVSKHPL